MPSIKSRNLISNEEKYKKNIIAEDVGPVGDATEGGALSSTMIFYRKICLLSTKYKTYTCQILMLTQMSKTCSWERRVVDGADDGTKNRRRHGEQIEIPNTCT